MSSYYEKILATGEVKCIDEEIPFEIPQGWEWCRMRDVIYPPKYGTSSKSLSNGDVPVLRMGNIQDGKVVYDKLVFSNNVEDNRQYLLQDGDLLFNRTNSAELVGKTAIFKGNRHVIYAGYLILLRPIKTNSEYLNYIFSSPYVRSYCKEVKTIGVQQCNINAEKVSQLLVPIAPFEEQMRIVDKIKEVLPSVDKYSISQYNLDLLNVSLSECLKKSILQEAIQGRLVPQIAEEGTAKELLEQIKKEKQKLVKEGKLKKSALATSIIFRGDDNKYYEQIGKKSLDITEQIPFEIPSNWEWCRVRNVSNSYIGLTYKPTDIDEKGTIVLRSCNIRNGKLALDDIVRVSSSISEKLLIEENDIIICARNGSKRLVGKSALIRNLPEPMTFGAFMAICKTPIYEYMFAYLQSDLFFGQLRDVSNTTTINQLTQNKFNDFLIPIPPIREQERIAFKISQLFQKLR